MKLFHDFLKEVEILIVTVKYFGSEDFLNLSWVATVPHGFIIALSISGNSYDGKIMSCLHLINHTLTPLQSALYRIKRANTTNKETHDENQMGRIQRTSGSPPGKVLLSDDGKALKAVLDDQ